MMMDTLLTIDAHDFITFELWWFAVGALTWLAMHHAGIIHKIGASRTSVMLLFSVGIIVGWPAVWLEYLKSLPRRYRAGKLWGRGR